MAYHPPHKIPEADFIARVKHLIPQLMTKQQANGYETDELWRLYNDRFLPFEPESGKNCGTCRTRVYQKILAYYETIKGE